MPVSAASSSGTMLYNGVELPDIESVWTDKVTYPYAVIYVEKSSGRTFLLLLQENLKPVFDGDVFYFGPGSYRIYLLSDQVWSSNGGNTVNSGLYIVTTISSHTFIWTSTDITNKSTGEVWLAASAPVDPNAPTPITGNMFFETVHPLDDSVSVVCAVSDLSDTTPTFDFRYTLSSGGTEVRSGISEETFTGIDKQYFHLTMSSLTPETEYDLTMSLYADGEDTGISASTTFTTLASSGSGAGEGESTTPDYTNQLGDIQQGIDDVQQSVDNVGSKLDDVEQAVTETKEEITSLPSKIASAIIDGIKSLFVPSEEDLTEIRDEYESMLSEKLGFIWQAFDLLTTFVSDLQTSLESGEAYEFNFPGVKVPINGEEFVFVPETPVSLENQLMDVLRPVLGTIVSAVAVMAFVNMGHDYVLAIISGVSAFQFENRRKEE